MKTDLPQNEKTPLQDSAAVSGANRKKLESLFRHPIAQNLEWNDVVALIDKIGDVERRSNN